MAIIVTVKSDTQDLKKAIKEFPDASFRVVRSVGKGGREELAGIVTSADSPVHLQAFPKDKRGRYTISSSVSKINGIPSSVRISSYTMNLFEFGRTLRNGRRESGRRIITGRLTTVMERKSSEYFKRGIDRHMKEFV